MRKTWVGLFLAGAIAGCGTESSKSGSSPSGPIVPPGPTVVEIAALPDPNAVEVGLETAFDVLALMSDGTVITPEVTWTTSDPAVATIDATGVAAGVAE